MKVILTSRQEIKTKEGVGYVIYNGVSHSGRSVEIFLSKDREQSYGLTEDYVIPSKVIAGLFEEFYSVDADFDQKGRLDAVVVPKQEG